MLRLVHTWIQKKPLKQRSQSILRYEMTKTLHQ